MNFDKRYQIKNMIYFLSLNYHKLDILDNIEDIHYIILKNQINGLVLNL